MDKRYERCVEKVQAMHGRHPTGPFLTVEDAGRGRFLPICHAISSRQVRDIFNDHSADGSIEGSDGSLVVECSKTNHSSYLHR